MKRWLRLSVLTGLLFVLVSCQGLGFPASNEETSSGEGEKENDVTTLSFFSADPNPNWSQMEDEVGKVITEKTGVRIDAEFAVGDPEQKIALIASSGDYPDMIAPKGSANMMVNAGAMMDLRPLIEEHAPHLQEVIGDYMKRLRWSQEDPSIYFIPNLSAVGTTYFDAGGGFQLQHAVVKELGYPEIKTVKDFENAIRAYKEKHPTIDGQPTIGLSLLAENWRMFISVTNQAFYTTGAPDDGEWYIDPETYEATYHYRRPEEKAYFRWLNHMNDIGLLDPESFVQSYDQYKSKIASGRVLALTDQQWNYDPAENTLESAGRFERTYGHYPVTLTEEFQRKDFQRTGYMAGWGVGITTDCEDPVKAIKFLDFLASEEGQILNNWGIQGKHYKVEDGQRIIPPEIQEQKTNNNNAFTKETGIGNYRFSVSYGDGVKDSTGNYYTTQFPSQIIEDYSDTEKEVLEAYGVETWKDLFPDEEAFPVKPWGAAWNITVPADSELNVTIKRSSDIMRKRVPEAILAEPEEFDAVWEQFMNDLEDAGIEEAEEQYTELVQNRVQLWNE